MFASSSIEDVAALHAEEYSDWASGSQAALQITD